MPKLLMHAVTRQKVDSLLSLSPHAVLISGTVGSGKETLAHYVAAQLLEEPGIVTHPYVKHIYPIKQSIGIENIREVRNFLSLKTAGQKLIRRAVIVYDAHLMTTEAQNALLKSLEEPPEDTIFILTAPDPNLLKITILSRVQQVRIEPVGKTMAENELAKKGYDSQAITSAYHMSGGRPALLMALLEQKNDHPLVAAIAAAKQLLQLNLYERLIQTESLIKDREQLFMLLEGLRRVMDSGLHYAALKDDHIQLKRFYNLSCQTQQASAALSDNANAKLVLTNLFLQM